MAKKDYQLTVRVDDHLMKRLQRMADETGESVSSVVRMILRKGTIAVEATDSNGKKLDA